ncbi:protease modulator HflC [Pinisolibacter aquiterrae]|uniref:protease modulator HflC n=1 Tax=Pinisolibacter aquiterrae TaxID=2815579 RepID=UPI001C3D652F|nr:protease modulator HflC [Pinisolibacter aquiterrae]MBV5265113.1 protease modulator HflC [Pinisolibacter aquiterrae]MCC8235557.1 protease modulator HflC [Pinisolibacter aquiterrae]
MKNGFIGLFAVAAAVVIAFVTGVAFVVTPTMQVLVLQFGQVKRAVVEPGIYFKIPFIQNVEYLDKRILDIDLNPQELIASDKKRLVVDAFARYRIIDPVQFYQSVRTIQGGNQRLNTFVSSAVRAVLADATFFEVVRDDRAGLMDKIRTQVDGEAKGIGVKIVDVKLRRADLPQKNSEAVFQRMQTERQREATELRAKGAEESSRIRAKAEAEKEILLAEANRDAERVRGEGDAERIKIFADAFGKDPDFFAFYRSMQAYEASMKGSDTRVLLSPNSSDFFRYLTDPKGGTSAGAK